MSSLKRNLQFATVSVVLLCSLVFFVQDQPPNAWQPPTIPHAALATDVPVVGPTSTFVHPPATQLDRHRVDDDVTTRRVVPVVTSRVHETTMIRMPSVAQASVTRPPVAHVSLPSGQKLATAFSLVTPTAPNARRRPKASITNASNFAVSLDRALSSNRSINVSSARATLPPPTSLNYWLTNGDYTAFDTGRAKHADNDKVLSLWDGVAPQHAASSSTGQTSEPNAVLTVYMCPRHWLGDFLKAAINGSRLAPLVKMGEVRAWVPLLQALYASKCHVRVSSDGCRHVEDFFNESRQLRLSSGVTGDVDFGSIVLMEDLYLDPLGRQARCNA